MFPPGTRKVFLIERVGTSEYQTLLDAEVFADAGNCRPAERILEAIAAPPYNCITAVFEKDYIDKDYQDELAIFYCKALRQYPHRCTRLHFFKADISSDASVLTMDFARCASDYVGFMVLRPTDLQRVGRTYIRAMVRNPDNEFITCTTAFTSHILGHKFEVQAMPFIQQDTQVGACAQACLWMVARYMSRLFEHREILPAEINHWAKSHSARGRHYPADNGLTFGQMLDGLEGMGLSPTSYLKSSLDDSSKHVESAFPITAEPNSQAEAYAAQLGRQRTAKLADIAYRYIESGLPVIFGTENHVLVGIGHKYDSTMVASTTIQRVPAFYVHNDNAGPYMEMPLFGPDPDSLTFDQIQFIIVVVPKEATLSAEEAERVAVSDIEVHLKRGPFGNNSTIKDVLAAYRPEFALPLTKLEYRTYLHRSVDFQRDLRGDVAAGVFDPIVANKLMQLDYPKFVWITEVSSSQFLNYARRDERKCFGRVLVDSTAPALTRSVIATHFADYLMINDRQGPADAAPDVSVHRNSTPFVHKFRRERT